MTDESPGPIQFDSVEDGQVVRVAAEEVRRWAQWSNRVEAVIVALTALMVILGLTWIYGLGQENRRGVRRIIECTTEGFPCYEEQQARTNRLLAGFVISLNEEHLAIECLLATVPEKRSDQTLRLCQEEAKAATGAKLEELNRQLEAEKAEAVKENGE